MVYTAKVPSSPGPNVSRKKAGACGKPTNLADTEAVTEMLGVTLAVSDTVGDADALAEVVELDTTHVEGRTPGPTKGQHSSEATSTGSTCEH